MYSQIDFEHADSLHQIITNTPSSQLEPKLKEFFKEIKKDKALLDNLFKIICSRDVFLPAIKYLVDKALIDLDKPYDASNLTQGTVGHHILMQCF